MIRSLAFLLCWVLLASSAGAQTCANPGTGTCALTDGGHPKSVSSMPFINTYTGAVTLPLGAKVGQILHSKDFGDSASGATTTCTINNGSTALTLGAGNDFLVGNGILCLGAGPNFTAGAPISPAAVQNGTTGGTSIQYALATDDGQGGISTEQTVTVSNGSATQTTLNNVAITFTPASTNPALPTLIWKNVASAGWNYIGAVIPQVSASIGAAGSGYNNGTFWWSSTGATQCVVQPAGTVTISGGAITSVTAFPYWTGCTSLPSVNMPAAAGAGSSGSITLSWTGQFIDAGSSPANIAKPWYVPSTPPASAQNDWLVTSISSITGTSAVVTNSASNSVTTSTALHDETAAIQAGLNAAATAASSSPGAAAKLQLSCGSHYVSSGLTITQTGVGIEGEGIHCAVLRGEGIANTFTFKGTTGSFVLGNYIRELYFEDQHKTAGWAILGNFVRQFGLSDLQFNHSPGGMAIVNWQDIRIRDIQGYSLFGQGYSDLDLEATWQNGGVIGDVNNVGFFDNGLANNSGNQTRRAFAFNAIMTLTGHANNTSNAEGYGVWMGNTIVVNSGSNSTSFSPQFIFQTAFNAEYATSGNYYQHDGSRFYCVSCYAQAALTGTDNVYIGPLVTNFQWLGGINGGAGGRGFNIFGTQGVITAASVGNNSQASQGGVSNTLCNIELQGGVYDVSIHDNLLGSTSNQAHCPVLLDSGSFGNNIAHNVLVGDAVDSITDNSAHTSNNIVFNNGDTSPGLFWDNIHKAFGINSSNPYSDLSSTPGFVVKGSTASAGYVRQLVENTGAGGYVDYQMATATGNSFVDIRLFDASFVEWFFGSGTTPKLRLDAGLTVVQTTAPAFAAGQAAVWSDAVNGGMFAGQGSTYDACLVNNAGSPAACVPTGQTQLKVIATLFTAASATSGPSINMPNGTAPTSPNAGDIWTTSAVGGLFFRTNSVSYQTMVVNGVNTMLNGLAIDGTTPTSCSSTGSGSGASCAFGGNSNGSVGKFIITAGTTASASGTFTVTPGTALLGGGVPVCIWQLVDLGTGWASKSWLHDTTSSTSSYTGFWDNNGTALTNAGTYQVNYHCIGK